MNPTVDPQLWGGFKGAVQVREWVSRMGSAGGLREVTWDVQVGEGNLQRRCGTCLDPHVVNHIHKGVRHNDTLLKCFKPFLEYIVSMLFAFTHILQPLLPLVKKIVPDCQYVTRGVLILLSNMQSWWQSTTSANYGHEQRNISRNIRSG